MRLLVLGGTVFLSRAVAEEAVRRGHEVTCACRGESGSVPQGATHVRWDRDQPAPDRITTSSYDAVVDVARHPSRVRSAVAAVPDAHWIFVSTVNVYADNATAGGTPETTSLLAPLHTDEDPTSGPETYGAMKVACEQAVLDGAASALVVRPGLIAGPDDPSGRFTYWPARFAAGGEVLAPGSPHDVVQIIDARDLAAWIVDSAESGRAGTYDGVGPAMPIGDLLEQVRAGAEDADTPPVELTWVDQEFLAEHDVAPWSGEDAIPLWLPRPEYDGMLAHDAGPSLLAGLTVRPVEETSRDIVTWLRATPEAGRTGISADRERELLASWSEGHTSA